MSNVNNPNSGYLNISTSGQGYIVFPTIYPAFESASSVANFTANVVYGMQVNIPFQISITTFNTLIDSALILGWSGYLVANASGGRTVYTRSGGIALASALVGSKIICAGFTHAGNNGIFPCTANTTTTMTLTNPNGVAETAPAGSSCSVAPPTGAAIGYGLYTLSGNQIVAGVMTPGTTLGVSSVSVSTTVINPGNYLFCWSSSVSNSAGSLSGFKVSSGGQLAGGFGLALPYFPTPMMFSAANASSSGVLPSTLGALTGLSVSVPVCVCTP